MSEWTETTLDEEYEFKSGLSKSRDQFGFGYAFVSFKDVFYNFFLPTDLSELANTTDKEQESCSVNRGDVFLTRTSETFNELGMSSVSLKDYEKATFNGFTKRLRPKPNSKIWPEYIGYYFRSSYFRSLVTSMATMTTRASLNNEILSKLKVKYPPLPEQKSIAHILGTLDDKIELNRQMNRILEAMAQALFKSWFVDFDPVMDNALSAGSEIPDELQGMAEKRLLVADTKKIISTNPELSAKFPSAFEYNEIMGKWIPEGWEDVEVGNILNRLKISNRYKKDQVNEFGKVPVYEQGADILLGYHENEPDIDASINDPAFIFGDHTCVMILSISPFSISANVIALKGKIRNTIWTYFGLQGVQSFEEYRRHWMELIVKSIILPPEELCDKFQELLKASLQKKFETQKQIETLTQLRDALLSELISGRVRVIQE